jgi:tetratricopeptide (TPR) repeat protein
MRNTANVIGIGLAVLSLLIFSFGCKQEPPKSDLQTAIEAAARQQTPENYLALSLKYYEAKQFEKCIEAAREALKLRPDYALAYNNMCAAYNNLGKYDEGIKACREAIKLDPEFNLAKNNLNWALSQKQSNKKE